MLETTTDTSRHRAPLPRRIFSASGVALRVESGEEITISVASIAELHFGVLVARDERVRANRLRRLSRLQRRFDPLPVDDAVAASYGQLAVAVVRAGLQHRARVIDLLIAATAHAQDARLYTRNPKDLAGIDGLVEVVPV